MKLLIAGGREFSDYSLLKSTIESLDTIPSYILSGRCSSGYHTFTTKDGLKVYGADGLAEKYAFENEILFSPHPALWNSYPGKSAAAVRNRQMAELCDYALFFWDGKSKGTQLCLSFVEKLKKPFKIIKY